MADGGISESFFGILGYSCLDHCCRETGYNVRRAINADNAETAPATIKDRPCYNQGDI